MNTGPADGRAAELVFYRRWAWRDTLRRYAIIVDGKRRGLLGHRSTLRAWHGGCLRQS